MLSDFVAVCEECGGVVVQFSDEDLALVVLKDYSYECECPRCWECGELCWEDERVRSQMKCARCSYARG